MNLQPINPRPQPRDNCLCVECGKWFNSRWHGYADLDGEPFRAYVCVDCAAAKGRAHVEILRDGRLYLRAIDEDAAFEVVHQAQGQSYDYATRYGGWSVVKRPAVEAPA